METIAVIFGGRSAEHDVSIVTALASIIKPLELTKRYKVAAIYIAKDGAWYWDEKLKDINLFTSGKIQDFMHHTQPTSVQFDGGMTLIKASGIAGRKQQRKVDVVFPAMHGTYGEDGSLMGVLRMANIPFVGCDMDASVIAMDKVLAKLIAEAHGINTPQMQFADRVSYSRNPKGFADACEQKLTYPLFVKPAHLGSSIGISRVEDRKQLDNALEVAFHYDEKVLVEEAVSNLIEVTLPIIGNDQPKHALLERPMTNPEDFFDFDTKYMQGGKKGKGGSKGIHGYSQLPADLPKDLYKTAEETGLAVYKAFGCSGIARVDMLIDSKANAVYFNEVNPLPGDLYRHNWQEAGLSSIDLVQKLVAYAKERHTSRNSTMTTFTTNYLQQF